MIIIIQSERTQLYLLFQVTSIVIQHTYYLYQVIVSTNNSEIISVRQHIFLKEPNH